MISLRSIAFLLCASAVLPAHAQDLYKSADLDQMFARAGRTPVEITPEPATCCKIRLLVIDRQTGAYEVKDGNDRVVYIRRGRAAGTIAGQRKISAGPKEIINVPRNTALRLEPRAERIEAIEVVVFPAEDQKPPRFGAVKAPPDVITAAEMEALYAKFDTEQSLYIQPHFRAAFVIRTIPSAYESHGCCVDIYLPVHVGSAHVLLGGKIENPQERGPGEIRGSGMTGSRAAEIVPGDMVVTRRAGEHYIDPRPGKVGYLIVKIQAE
jgi:hypothetical protein